MDEEEGTPRPSGWASSETTLLCKEHLNDEPATNIDREPLWRRYIQSFCVHLSMFLAYSTLVLLVLKPWSKTAQQIQNILYSPANEALRWQIQVFDLGDGVGPYSGYPRPELEEAWGKLLGNQNIRLPLEAVRYFGREEDAVLLPDGSGYVGTLNVFHEIHCVRWLHKFMYHDHYFPDADNTEFEANRIHAEHCLNQLRATAMCHGDVGIVPYSWVNDTLKPKAEAISHQCIDFEKLTEWVDERTVDMFEPGLLVHPTLGPVYGEDESKGVME
ncbi:uncharacterized protein PAC_09218 [Phialocephala subalpina]|uniref:Tat pathway signal sequence n=1 Tax=Phialocephala subalpina TaxID=576137 RepID=A0A1L7X2T3_9HELO|nr:uncharacterized protein PAC_09218 [Phialocephala subalpina]